MHKHALVKRRFGAIYDAYSPKAYYFDLVDMLRRLLLTGGLIVLGERSNSQILLGALVCVCWLCCVLAYQPYRAKWDNILSTMLSFQLLVIILTGMSLEIYRLTPSFAQDPVEEGAFGTLMVLATICVLVIGITTILFALPCFRKTECAVRVYGRNTQKQKVERTKVTPDASRENRAVTTREAQIDVVCGEVSPRTVVVPIGLVPVETRARVGEEPPAQISGSKQLDVEADARTSIIARDEHVLAANICHGVNDSVVESHRKRATDIQRVFRGWKRRRYSRNLVQSRRQKQTAVALIQRVWRGAEGRKIALRLCELNEERESGFKLYELKNETRFRNVSAVEKFEVEYGESPVSRETRSQINSAIVVQSAVRQRLAVSRVQRMRDDADAQTRAGLRAPG